MPLKRNLHKAAIRGKLGQVPKELLTNENLTAYDIYGDTLFHKAASKGTLDKLPKELITETNFLTISKMGFTVFDVAAMYGHLDQIPDELLTDNVMVRSGISVLHLAAGQGHLDQVPRRLLTEDNLLVPITDPKFTGLVGKTTLHQANSNGHLDQLLGVELSERVRHIVGTNWYNRNQGVCEEMRKSKMSLATEECDEYDIELF